MRLPTKDEVEALAILGGVLAFMVALYQYDVAQRWKRAEWVASEMHRFLDDPWVRVACTMLDWGARKVRLPPDASDPEMVTDEDIEQALQYHDDRACDFSVKEALIRDAFDRFLDGLERCASNVQSGLVRDRDFAPYLSYWAYHIHRAERGDSKVKRLVQLKAFAKAYGYSGALALIGRLERFHSLPNLAKDP
jgi:hypothetical protein